MNEMKPSTGCYCFCSRGAGQPSDWLFECIDSNTQRDLARADKDIDAHNTTAQTDGNVGKVA